MKTKVTANIPKVHLKEFPCLVKQKYTDMIVLFSAASQGLIIDRGVANVKAGQNVDHFDIHAGWDILPKGTEITIEVIE